MPHARFRREPGFGTTSRLLSLRYGRFLAVISGVARDCAQVNAHRSRFIRNRPNIVGRQRSSTSREAFTVERRRTSNEDRNRGSAWEFQPSSWRVIAAPRRRSTVKARFIWKSPACPWSRGSSSPCSRSRRSTAFGSLATAIASKQSSTTRTCETRSTSR